jgi:hypothetical protein
MTRFKDSRSRSPFASNGVGNTEYTPASFIPTNVPCTRLQDNGDTYERAIPYSAASFWYLTYDNAKQ